MVKDVLRMYIALRLALHGSIIRVLQTQFSSLFKSLIMR